MPNNMKAKKHHFIKEEKPKNNSVFLENDNQFNKRLEEWEGSRIEFEFEGWKYVPCTGLSKKGVGAIALSGDLAVCAWIGSTKYEDHNGLSLEVLKLLINE